MNIKDLYESMANSDKRLIPAFSKFGLIDGPACLRCGGLGECLEIDEEGSPVLVVCVICEGTGMEINK